MKLTHRIHYTLYFVVLFIIFFCCSFSCHLVLVFRVCEIQKYLSMVLKMWMDLNSNRCWHCNYNFSLKLISHSIAICFGYFYVRHFSAFTILIWNDIHIRFGWHKENGKLNQNLLMEKKQQQQQQMPQSSSIFTIIDFCCC